MTKRACVFSLITLFMVFTAFTAHADEWGTVTIPAGKPIKIGLGAMLTGDYASLGIDIRNGAEMAVEEKGSLLGHQNQHRGLQAEECPGFSL